MRRSAAPSLREDKCKRFKSPFLNTEYESHSTTSFPSEVLNNVPSESDGNSNENVVRSEEEILQLILSTNSEPTYNHGYATVTKGLKKLKTSSHQSLGKQIKFPNTFLTLGNFGKSESQKNSLHKRNDDSINQTENVHPIRSDDAQASHDLSTPKCYNVMWCKRSSKKHKIWEGDGILIVSNRSVVLKDLDGKVIDRGAGYKLKDISELEEGKRIFIGGKECEIQDEILDPESISAKHLQLFDEVPQSSPKISSMGVRKPSSSLQYYCPLLRPPFKDINTGNIENHVVDALTLPKPPPEHQATHNRKNLPVVDVIVEEFLNQHLRPHQKEGIIFMYRCIMGFQENGEGVILADEMGLGKTLQCIALMWTLYKQGPYEGRAVIKQVIIITPSSLVDNWKKEIFKWLGKSRLSVYAVSQQNKISDYIKCPQNVLIISYEMFLRSAELLSDVPFDLVICDEGHRIKNINIKISNVINCLTTTRRILLTGTPIQNDLQEFFSIVDFVNPGVLGTVQKFRRYFENPILQSRNPECSEYEKELGEERSEELTNITKEFVIRRTQDVINQYLPPKTETVIFCRPSPLQEALYRHLLGSITLVSYLNAAAAIDSSTHLEYISALRKLCNHPSLLFKEESTKEEEEDYSIYSYVRPVFPEGYHPSIRDAGKMKVLKKILSSLFSQKSSEKVVIVSGFTKTLNIIEVMCQTKGYEYLRLDGSTSTSIRQNLVDSFNLPYTKYVVFLLSAKAGGVGFNLIGASRIVLYDLDWNPANDLQAMARIWRDGQKRPVFIYRLLTTGTIEEKIFQRQVLKQSLSQTVFNSAVENKLQFSHEELKDLFTFHEDVQCLTHDLINCSCLITEHSEQDSQDKENSGKTHFKNAHMAELLKWKHVAAPITNENISDNCLADVGNHVTFLFINTVNL